LSFPRHACSSADLLLLPAAPHLAIAAVVPRSNVRLSFAFVYPDRRGVSVMKQVGEVFADPRVRHTPDDDKSLQQLQFQTGDFLDVAIL
jgi:histone deacetylase complex subunit SAP18